MKRRSRCFPLEYYPGETLSTIDAQKNREKVLFAMIVIITFGLGDNGKLEKHNQEDVLPREVIERIVSSQEYSGIILAKDGNRTIYAHGFTPSLPPKLRDGGGGFFGSAPDGSGGGFGGGSNPGNGNGDRRMNSTPHFPHLPSSKNQKKKKKLTAKILYIDGKVVIQITYNDEIFFIHEDGIRKKIYHHLDFEVDLPDSVDVEYARSLPPKERLKYLDEVLPPEYVGQYMGKIFEHIKDPNTYLKEGTIGANRESEGGPPKTEGYHFFNPKNNLDAFFNKNNKRFQTGHKLNGGQQRDFKENGNVS